MLRTQKMADNSS